MPFSPKNCTSEDIDLALTAHTERLGQILIDSRVIMRDLERQAAVIDSEILEPLERNIEKVLASSGLSSQDMTRIGGFPVGVTRLEREKDIANLGLSIINGRVLVTKNGDLNVSAVRDLHRLTGSMDSIKKLLPELGNCYISQDMTAGSSFKSRFIIVVTYQKVDIIKGEGCKSDSQEVSEVVIGVDTPIDQVLINNPTLVRQDLIIYIFWFGAPEARQDLKDKALRYGLTEVEYFDSILNRTGENFKVKVISNPYKQVCLLAAFLGDDVDSFLGGNTLPGSSGNTIPISGTKSDSYVGVAANGSQSIKLFPEPSEIMKEISDSGILTAQPGRTNPAGFTDYSIPSILFLSTVDFEKTFGNKGYAEGPCTNTDLDLSKYYEDIFEGIDSISKTVNTLISEAVGKAANFVSKLSDKVSKIDAIFLKLLSCVIPGGGLGLDSLGLSVPFSFNEILGLMNKGLDLFDAYFAGLSKLLNILSLLSCLKFSMKELLTTSVISKVPGIECIADTFQVDVCINYSLNIGGLEAQLATNALASVLANISSLVSLLLSFSLRLPTAYTNQNCLTPEAAILAAKLVLRGIVLSVGIPKPKNPF